MLESVREDTNNKGNDSKRRTRKCCVPVVQSIKQKVRRADGRPHAIVAPTQYLWDNESTIAYSFMGGNNIQKEKVHLGIHTWSMYINVTFSECDSGGDIRISFADATTSWSYVGLQAKYAKSEEPTMNLGWVDETTDHTTPSEMGTILHEFGHALGLLHEHQSPARKGKLTFRIDHTIKHYWETIRWTFTDVVDQVLRKFEKTEYSHYSELDFKSIMMYSTAGEITEEGQDIPENNVLSEKDKAYIILNYPRSIPHPDAPEWTIRHALQIASVDDDVREIILSASHPNDIRNAFIRWAQSLQDKSSS